MLYSSGMINKYTIDSIDDALKLILLKFIYTRIYLWILPGPTIPRIAIYVVPNFEIRVGVVYFPKNLPDAILIQTFRL